jgi:threonine 3-dehydrogenase
MCSRLCKSRSETGVNTMKALVKVKAEEGLSLREEPVPTIGADDILIKVAKTGICGTDLHIWTWDEWAQKTIPVPMVVGHEFSGVVAEVGSHVRTVKVGDRVSGEGHLIGMKSRMARAGHFHLDPETKGIGVNVPGAFAEYLKLPAFNAIHLPPEIDDEIGAILDPLGNAVHTALSFDLIGEDVLITGAGPIGIMAAAVCRHVGARHVVVTDINDYRLELCNQVTDAVTVNVSKVDLHDVMAKLHMQEGFDIGLEMSGAPKAFAQMVDHMIMGGKIAMLGIPAVATPVDWNKVIFKSLTIKGIYGREMFETWYKMIAMVQSGLDVRKVITHRMKASDFAQGFALMKQGACGKVVLDWV